MRVWCTKEPADKSFPGAEVFADKERGQLVHRGGSVASCHVGDSEQSLWAAAVGPGDTMQEQEMRCTLGSDAEDMCVLLWN